MRNKRRPGRPAFPRGAARNQLIGVRVSARDLAVFRETAQVEGLTLAQWVYRALLRAAGLTPG